MLFSRNIGGYQLPHYYTLLDWSRDGSSRFVRIQLDSLGMGYTSTGAVDENWAVNWEMVLDRAEADGIYVLPVFSGWFDWNAGQGYSTWKTNPLNQANGGPVKSPAEFFQTGSNAQTLWMNWVKAVVERWHGRRNILAWEIFSEVNLASGSTESSGIEFVNTAADVIRAVDPGRPVTASIADTGLWPNFYRDANIDFINIHPYPSSARLDRTLVAEVRKSLARYHRPVLIGESGLSAATPDSSAGKATVAKEARIGIRHAIWAGVVSGAMNARSLYWEDGYGIYFPALGLPWMQDYALKEHAAAKFTAGVDFTGFQPLDSTFSSGVWGAAVGNEKMVLGWYRDATCEPPDWKLKPLVYGQSVTITVPGQAADWKMDFYDTHSGTIVTTTMLVTRQGSTIKFALPYFTDDIAFKLYALP